jgi:hypothetical protein
VLEGIGDPLAGDGFTFEKGASHGFDYKNLSGGEKAAFDLLLDLLIQRRAYADTIYCIDEPELHMNTRLQATLFDELLSVMPDNCQLWLATHSIGMMRQAANLKAEAPDQVAFLDFQGHDFDGAVELGPVAVSRDFWKRSLDVALGDLAALVAPARVVLCEGQPAGASERKAEFDAECYRKIFADEFPDTDFMSVGNSEDVGSDRLEVGRTIQALASGTEVVRLIDRDSRSDAEVKERAAQGVRVLTRRHIEAYLLDDEILARLCESAENADKFEAVRAIKSRAVAASVGRGNPPDDLKSASGDVYVETKKLLGLYQHGNTARAFLRDTIAPLLTPDTIVYAELRRDIFGEL